MASLTNKEDDMIKIVLVSLIIFFPILSSAGEIYGTIRTAGGPVGGGVPITVECPGTRLDAKTDRFGSYLVFVPREGRCTMKVQYGVREIPAIEVFSYQTSVRYNLLLEPSGDGYTLRRE